MLFFFPLYAKGVVPVNTLYIHNQPSSYAGRSLSLRLGTQVTYWSTWLIIRFTTEWHPLSDLSNSKLETSLEGQNIWGYCHAKNNCHGYFSYEARNKRHLINALCSLFNIYINVISTLLNFIKSGSSHCDSGNLIK